MPTPAITRPDGRAYRSRKTGLRVHAWNNDDPDGVIVLGTLDPDAARPLAEQACGHWYGTTHVKNPEPGWYRDAFEWGERRWARDERRGAPGVSFTWDGDA